MPDYPKRLIEVDLPIKRISAHARREKSIRHGHISTLHIWWARRPLAACRAVICASLWPDPADELCPQSFRDKALELMKAFAEKAVSGPDIANHCHPESMGKYYAITGRTRPAADTGNAKKHLPTPELNATDPAHLNILRYLLLDFIADFANWDNSTVRAYLDTSRALTQAAHEALGGLPGTRPLVVDPFAGGGSIPLEALRVGADAFASDLNPVAVLLNKVVLEYIPKYGQQLADEVRKWGQWIKEEAEKELAAFYPRDPDGATPIAYLWARTVRCEGPGCGAEVPLMRSLWLAKKANRSVALQIVPNPDAKRVDFRIIVKRQGDWVDQAGRETAVTNPKFDGTVKRGSATCPCCGYTTPVASVRAQLKSRRGGANDARLFCVVTTRPGEQGRFYRQPCEADLRAVGEAARELGRRRSEWTGELPLVPEELTPRGGGSGAGRAFSQRHYGMEQFCDLFTSRQLLALTTLGRLVREAGERLREEDHAGLAEAVQVCLALVVDRCADYLSSLVIWANTGEFIAHTFGRQALPVVWEFPECCLLAEGSGNLAGAIEWVAKAIEAVDSPGGVPGNTVRASATKTPLPDDFASAFVTDPPYYDAVPYADLSDFFYVWLRRTLPAELLSAFASPLSPKDDECIVDETKGKDRQYFECTMAGAMAEGRRFLKPGGVGLVVFAHKSTTGWEALLEAMVGAGWIVTASWAIDTEREGRLRSQNSAALASSVHLVCRPRENPDGSLREDDTGELREVLQKLPARIHEWMPRLALEGVVGADAIFACLGPALEIFSRYSRVEKASGETVPLREYLEHVWAAVSREALTVIFEGADATGFEPDARITAMWLWTLSAEAGGNGKSNGAGQTSTSDEETADDEEGSAAPKQTAGYALEFDAARKIAQGLGVDLDRLPSVVEVKGASARLLSVSERAAYLFGKDGLNVPSQRTRRSDQLSLDAMLDPLEEQDVPTNVAAIKSGETVLDRVHQSMLLFAAGRGEALQRFLVEDGIGRDQQFWKLAQALSALYPRDSDEKRWVDGVLARKKGLGL